MVVDFRDLAAQSQTAYRQLLIDAAQGVEVDPASALNTAIAAGYSAAELARHVEAVSQLREDTTNFDADAWADKVEQARQASLKASAAAEKASDAVQKANERRQQAVSDVRMATEAFAAANRDRDEAKHAVGSLLIKHCVADENGVVDWRGFDLATF